MSNQPSNQRVDQAWETPSPEAIVGISKWQIAEMEADPLNECWNLAGMPHIILHTMGRKTGARHKVALPTWTDAEGHLIVVASFAGARQHPAWFFNIKDAPSATIRTPTGLDERSIEVLSGDDYNATWAALVADRAWYADYQAATERQIPLLRLVG